MYGHMNVKFYMYSIIGLWNLFFEGPRVQQVTCVNSKKTWALKIIFTTNRNKVSGRYL